MRLPLVLVATAGALGLFPGGAYGQARSDLPRQDSIFLKAEDAGFAAGNRGGELGFFASGVLTGISLLGGADLVLGNSGGEVALAGAGGLVASSVLATKLRIAVPEGIEAGFAIESPESQAAYVRGYERGVVARRKQAILVGNVIGAALCLATYLFFGPST